MVASSCATFMIGPLRPPSAAARAEASRSRSGSSPSRRVLAMRAATVPTLAPTRPWRCTRAVRRLRSLSEAIDLKGKAENGNCRGVSVTLTLTKLYQLPRRVTATMLAAGGLSHEHSHPAPFVSDGLRRGARERRRHRTLNRGLEIGDLQMLRRLGQAS